MKDNEAKNQDNRKACLRNVACIATNGHNMKINVATRKATANNTKNNPAKAQVSETPKTVAVKITIPGGLKWLPGIAILTGARGIAARQIESAVERKTGRVFVHAVYDENGLKLGAKAIACEIVNGILTGDKPGRIQLGGYVNGRNTGAKIIITTLAAFIAKSQPCLVRWSNADDGEKIHGRYVGNPAMKGLLAVMVKYGNGFSFVWQVEQDSNANNRHERGEVLPLKEGATLSSVNW